VSVGEEGAYTSRWQRAAGTTVFTYRPCAVQRMMGGWEIELNRLCSPPASMHDHDDDDYQHGNNQEEPRDIYPPCPPWFSLVLL
jgi:hypothetical protein